MLLIQEGFDCSLSTFWKLLVKNYCCESHVNIIAFKALQNMTPLAKQASTVMALLLMICRRYYYLARYF